MLAGRMSVPLIGERYRGAEGRSGYLLRQAWAEFRGAMDDALRPHGIILQIDLTAEGRRRLDATTPTVHVLEAAIEEGFSDDEVALVRAWLVEAARRLERI